MKLIQNHDIISMLNHAYMDFNPKLDGEPYEDCVLAFANMVHDQYGIQLKMFPKSNNMGQLGYEITEAYVFDEPKYTWFLLKWGSYGV